MTGNDFKRDQYEPDSKEHEAGSGHEEHVTGNDFKRDQYEPDYGEHETGSDLEDDGTGSDLADDETGSDLKKQVTGNPDLTTKRNVPETEGDTLDEKINHVIADLPELIRSELSNYFLLKSLDIKVT